MSDHDHAHDGDGFDVNPHISSTKQNLVILFILFALTALTLAAYNIRLGDANLFVAILIATIKATFVGAFFMHLKYDTRFHAFVFFSTVLFVGIFFALTFFDLKTRDMMNHTWDSFQYARDAGLQDKPALIDTKPLTAEERAKLEAEGGHH